MTELNNLKQHVEQIRDQNPAGAASVGEIESLEQQISKFGTQINDPMQVRICKFLMILYITKFSYYYIFSQIIKTSSVQSVV